MGVLVRVLLKVKMSYVNADSLLSLCVRIHNAVMAINKNGNGEIRLVRLDRRSHGGRYNGCWRYKTHTPHASNRKGARFRYIKRGFWFKIINIAERSEIYTFSRKRLCFYKIAISPQFLILKAWQTRHTATRHYPHWLTQPMTDNVAVLGFKKRGDNRYFLSLSYLQVRTRSVSGKYSFAKCGSFRVVNSKIIFRLNLHSPQMGWNSPKSLLFWYCRKKLGPPMHVKWNHCAHWLHWILSRACFFFAFVVRAV